MDLFFTCMCKKQRVYIDVGQAAKVEDIQEMLRALLDLPETPHLMHPTKITTAETRHDISRIKWESMTPSKALSSYGYTKENALAHEPIPLAFMMPDDEEPTITPLSIPKPIPAEIKGEIEMKEEKVGSSN